MRDIFIAVASGWMLYIMGRTFWGLAFGGKEWQRLVSQGAGPDRAVGAMKWCGLTLIVAMMTMLGGALILSLFRLVGLRMYLSEHFTYFVGTSVAACFAVGFALLTGAALSRGHIALQPQRGQRTQVERQSRPLAYWALIAFQLILVLLAAGVATLFAVLAFGLL